jgi:SAM-dependent methyltransferase
LSQYTFESHIAALLDSLCASPAWRWRLQALTASNLAASKLRSETGEAAESEQQAKRTLRYFDGIASRWHSKWESKGPFRRRLDLFLAPLAAELPRGSRVLDFGCGTGELARGLCDAGYAVWALDNSAAMIDCCRKAILGSTVRTLHPKLEGWSRIHVDDGFFDAIVASSVLEYIDDVELQLNEVARSLRPGGLLVVTVPNCRNLVRVFESVLRWVVNRRTINLFRCMMSVRTLAYCEYLDLSINRFSVEYWRECLKMSGFEAVQTWGDGQALVRITARRARQRGSFTPNSVKHGRVDNLLGRSTNVLQAGEFK